MIQLLFSWLMSVGQGITSTLGQLFSLIFHPTWLSQSMQWAMKNLMEDSVDSTRIFVRTTASHIKHSIRHPHPPLTRDVQIWIILMIPIFCWSTFAPQDRLVWFLNVSPGLVLGIVLIGVFYRILFTQLSYWLFFIQVAWMLVMGHGFDFNNQEYAGCFLQGFATVIFLREILLRNFSFRRGDRLLLASVAISIVVGMLYKFIEWFVIQIAGYSDAMTLQLPGIPGLIVTFLGASVSMLTLSSLHDQQMTRVSRYIRNLPPKKKTRQS